MAKIQYQLVLVLVKMMMGLVEMSDCGDGDDGGDSSDGNWL